MNDDVRARGASPPRRRYDLSQDFYALWLDASSMSSTCALYEEGDDLDRAQLRKLDHHVAAARAAQRGRVLDVGCGWGHLLHRLVHVHGVGRAVGLTISQMQAQWIGRRSDPRIEVRLESWVDHEPAAPYDAILSIEAIESFARPGLPSSEKVKIYRAFFERCHRWLRPGGGMSLQAIAYGNSDAQDLDGLMADELFPESDLPKLAEIMSATERLFEIATLRNDREHYTRTLRAWLDRLQEHRAEAEALVGEAIVDRHLRSLRLRIYLFASGGCDLHRIALRRIDSPRDTGGARTSAPPSIDGGDDARSRGTTERARKREGSP
ncbi:MAG TPA: class I SAM-dependent methyltransferase [Polyangia bacterium]|nr:class I SAM-dependent methyltransferase [Polyangia bacterium]